MINTPKCLVLTDFTSGNLLAALNHDKNGYTVEAVAGPPGELSSLLFNSGHQIWNERYDAILLWTQPQRISPSFEKSTSNIDIEITDITADVERFAVLIEKAAKYAGIVLIPTWNVPVFRRGLGTLDLKHPIGTGNILRKMNNYLIDICAENDNVYVLDSNRWLNLAGRDSFSQKLWYMAKIPYSQQVFNAAVLDIKAAIGATRGLTRKLVVVDLDNTLWGGIVGDAGWEHLAIGGHSFAGEAFTDVQKFLKGISRRGILLAISSKNDHDIAIDAIRKHPEMVLGLDDFVSMRINWNDKAQNIVDIAHELNLGLQSIVFIDDNPAERARVRDALPEVLVPELPSDPMLVPAFLNSLQCFDTLQITVEDHHRTAQYIAEKKRVETQKLAGTIDEWLKNLDTRVVIELLCEGNLPRTVQLLNKTNQMNLSTRRMSEMELEMWSKENGNFMWTFRVSDRFGDSGLTAIGSLQLSGKQATIVDFIVSCRVMGRGVEESVLWWLCTTAKQLGAEQVVAHYLSTQKNNPCHAFFTRSGFEKKEKTSSFYWNTTKDYPCFSTITIESPQPAVQQ